MILANCGIATNVTDVHGTCRLSAT